MSAIGFSVFLLNHSVCHWTKDLHAAIGLLFLINPGKRTGTGKVSGLVMCTRFLFVDFNEDNILIQWILGLRPPTPWEYKISDIKYTYTSVCML